MASTETKGGRLGAVQEDQRTAAIVEAHAEQEHFDAPSVVQPLLPEPASGS